MAKAQTDKKQKKKKEVRKTVKKTAKTQSLEIVEGIDLSLKETADGEALRLLQKEPKNKQQIVTRKVIGWMMILAVMALMIWLVVSGRLAMLVLLVVTIFAGLTDILEELINGPKLGMVVRHPGEFYGTVEDLPMILILLTLVIAVTVLVVLVAVVGGILIAEKEVPTWVWYLMTGMAMAAIMMASVWGFSVMSALSGSLGLETLVLVVGNIVNFGVGVYIIRRIHLWRHPEGIVEKV